MKTIDVDIVKEIINYVNSGSSTIRNLQDLCLMNIGHFNNNLLNYV